MIRDIERDVVTRTNTKRFMNEFDLLESTENEIFKTDYAYRTFIVF
jgi:hypothetical protein